MKNVFILAGSNGIGKKKICFNLANRLNHNNLYSEIVLFDHINQYKDLNLFANKPPKEYITKIRYHNLNQFGLAEAFSMNSSVCSSQTRKKLIDLVKEGVNPIIQGGTGFYLKTLLSGGSNYLSKEETVKYLESRRIARKIIVYDNHNFELTLNRLIKSDKSFDKESIPMNDFYRLEKSFADLIFYGNDGYITKIKRDEESRKENELLMKNFRFIKIFLFTEKELLVRKIQEKCLSLLINGLLIELIDLIKSKAITPENFYSLENPLKNSQGFSEAINLLIDLWKLLPNKNEYIKSFEKEHREMIKERKHIHKIFGKFVYDYVKGCYQSESKQLSWFSKDHDCIFYSLKENYEIDEVNEDIFNIYNQKFNTIIIEKLSIDKEKIKNLKQPIINPNSFEKPVYNINLLTVLKNIFKELNEINEVMNEFELMKCGKKFKKETIEDYRLIKKYLI